MNLPPIITAPGATTIDSQGSFVVGTAAMFFLTFVDINGELFDPSDITVTILDPDGGLEKTISAGDKIELGQFSVSWNIPKTAAPGGYTLQIDYTFNTAQGDSAAVFTEKFVVLEKGQGVMTLRRVAMRSYLESLIGYSQRIPIFREIARLNGNNTRAVLSFPGGIKSGPWNQTAGVQVYINGDERETGYTVDYLKGRIDFTNPLSDHDEVTVNYNFRWFTDLELDSFIEQGVNLINIWTPQSVYTIEDIPDRWIIGAEYAAAVDALRRWMMDVQFQEPAKIFGGLQRANDIFQHMSDLKKDYEEWLDKILEQKKWFPYLGLTKTVTVPEFTLPGGRSRWFRYLFKGG